MTDRPKPAHFLPSATDSFRYVEKTNPLTSNLQFLTYGVYELTGQVQSGSLAHPGEEALLFCWKGKVKAHLKNEEYDLKHYDVLYVPRGIAYRLCQTEGESKVIVCRAPA